MARKVKTVLKLNLRGGSANPAPPVGPALGQHGVNIMDFCNAYNEKTKEQRGQMIPAEVTIFDDRSFTFVTKLAPASEFIRQALKIKKGSSNPPSEVAGTLTKAQVREIAEKKIQDLNTNDVEAAMRTIEGAAKSMGVKVEG
ncbi:50S ribosomal protein L11 [Patescibacteria group bacterium]